MGRKPKYLKQKKETVFEEASREIAEDLFALMGTEEDKKMTLKKLMKATNLSKTEMNWIYENSKALAEGQIPTGDTERYHKHLVKKRIRDSSLDMMRFLPVSTLFFDELDEVIPDWVAYNMVRMWVAKEGLEKAFLYSSAIEQGMIENLKAGGIGSDLFQVTVPVQTRMPPEAIKRADTEILSKAYDRFLERVKVEEEKKKWRG